MITIDELDEAHARAGLDLLEDDGGLTVYESVAPDSPSLPYVLVYTVVEWPGEGEGKTLAGLTSTCVTRWYTHSVGGTDQSARTVANRVRQLLVNVRPVITGRSCGFIQQESTLPLQRDETTGSLVLDAAAVYVLTTFSG